MNKLVYPIFLALVLLVPGSVLMTPMNIAAQDDDAKLLVINGGVHDLNLKATLEDDGDIEEEEDFEIDVEDIIQTSEDELVIVTTEGTVDKVKVVNSALKTIELNALSKTSYDISDLPVGAYLLDVIVRQDDGDKLAYETVLIVLAEGQSLLSQEQITNIVKTFIKIDIKIIFKESKNNTKPPIVNITKPPITNNTELPVGNETGNDTAYSGAEIPKLEPPILNNETSQTELEESLGRFLEDERKLNEDIKQELGEEDIVQIPTNPDEEEEEEQEQEESSEEESSEEPEPVID